MVKFQDQTTYARNNVMKIFNAIQQLWSFRYFGQAGNLHYDLIRNGAFKLTVQYGKGCSVIMPQRWQMNEHTGNVWLRGLSKLHDFLCLRKPEATSCLVCKF